MTFRVIPLILLASVASVCAQSGRVTYTSPDHELSAVVIPAKRSARSSPTRYVDIYKADGSLTGREGSTVSDLAHPPRVSGAWSPDSQFFVFNVIKAEAPHAAFSTIVYVRKSEYRFYNLANYLDGVIADPGWSFRGRSRLRGRLVTRRGGVRSFEVDLSKIAWENIRWKKT